MNENNVVPHRVIPSNVLPPLKYRDLPDAIPLWKMIGPSVILLGAAIGSGEFVLWPYMVSHYGFGIWWACMLGILTQFWVNMEIERYTLATGESAIVGFVRIWKHWAWVFLACNAIPWVWPGWAMGAATCLSYLVGGNPVVYAVASMLLIGVILTAGPVLYKTMEKLQLVMVTVILVFVCVLFAAIVRADSVREMVSGSFRFGYIPEGVALPYLLGAIAYAGAGGSLNLAQSNYIKDKAYGMGAFIGRITSPITGQREAVLDTGFLPRETEENAAKWRRWWLAANWEHFLTFFLLGVISLVLLACIAHSTVFGLDIGEGMAFIKQQGIEIGKAFGGLARIGFLIAGALILLTTELGIMDMVARVSSDIIRTVWGQESKRWSLRKVYYLWLWGEILLGCTSLIAGFDKPLALLILGASLNGLVMALYSLLLLWVNMRVLPSWLAMGKVRFLAMVWACAFYGYFAMIVLRGQIAELCK